MKVDKNILCWLLFWVIARFHPDHQKMDPITSGCQSLVLSRWLILVALPMINKIKVMWYPPGIIGLQKLYWVSILSSEKLILVQPDFGAFLRVMDLLFRTWMELPMWYLECWLYSCWALHGMLLASLALTFYVPQVQGIWVTNVLQGEALFQTHENLEHLAMMERVFGPLPYHMLKRAEYVPVYDPHQCSIELQCWEVWSMSCAH